MIAKSAKRLTMNEDQMAWLQERAAARRREWHEHANTFDIKTLGWMAAIWAGGCFAAIAIALLHNCWKVF